MSAILSYCGQATLSVIDDARLVPNPQAITDQFMREFRTLLHTANAGADQEGVGAQHAVLAGWRGAAGTVQWHRIR